MTPAMSTKQYENWTLEKWNGPAPPDALDKEMEHRVAVLARQEDFDCCLLASFGIKARVIAEYTGLSIGQVTYRLQQNKIKINDFREGNGPYARMVFEYLDRRAANQLTYNLRRHAAPAPITGRGH
jgi:hypothetical protein